MSESMIITTFDLKDATVIFVMWGQSCTTKFSSASELDPITWIKTCYEKGFMLPVKVISSDGLVLYSEDQLRKMVSEL